MPGGYFQTVMTPMPPDNFAPSSDHAVMTRRPAPSSSVLLERTTTFQHGTRSGPVALLPWPAAIWNFTTTSWKWSPTARDRYRHSFPPLTRWTALEEVMTELFTAELALLDDYKFPVVGGEHPANFWFWPCTRKYKPLPSFIKHASLRDTIGQSHEPRVRDAQSR